MVQENIWSTLFWFGITPFSYLGSNTSVVVKVCVSTRNVWYLVSAQIHSGLLLGLPLLFLICMSFRRGMSFLLSCSFAGPKPVVTIGNDSGVTATCVSCFPSSAYDHQSLFLAPFLGSYSALLSTDRSSMFINPQKHSYVIPGNS